MWDKNIGFSIGMRVKVWMQDNKVRPLNSFSLLPTRSEERGLLGFGSIPVAILPSCQDMKTIAL